MGASPDRRQRSKEEGIVPAAARRSRATLCPPGRLRGSRGRLRLGDAPIRGSPGNGASLPSWGRSGGKSATMRGYGQPVISEPVSSPVFPATRLGLWSWRRVLRNDLYPESGVLLRRNPGGADG